MFDSCPGTSRLRTPTLTIKKCPRCNEDIEIFSSDVKVKCSKCGLEVFNDMNLCVHWCAYAKECVGPELYEQLKKDDTEHSEPRYFKGSGKQKETAGPNEDTGQSP